ncbi:hypothetical protein CICLE_v10024667mg [Citrus x clementina]|uniref:Uncharacterized protein n=1 Tax=Citrus clementina TaxID=85681 RepID=V4TVH1_CITCL|nr:hypothetical protein CICLE_v10024667mg [Citrus x clementina]
MAFFILLMFDKKGELCANSLYALPNVNISIISFPYVFVMLILFAVFECSEQFLSFFPVSLCFMQYDKENVVEAKFGEIEKERCDSVHSSPSFSHSLKNNTDLLEGLLFCRPAILDFRNLLFTQCSWLSNCQKVEQPFSV